MLDAVHGKYVYYLSPQILLATQAVPNRLYPIWACRELKSNVRPSAYESSDSVDIIAAEIITNLLKMGHFLGQKQKVIIYALCTPLDLVSLISRATLCMSFFFLFLFFFRLLG